MKYALILSALLGSASVMAESVQSPFQMRFNSQPVKQAFHSRDHEMFHSFWNFPFKMYPSVRSLQFSDLRLNLLPQKGSVEDFDFDLEMAQDKVGVSSSNVMVKGTGKFKGKEFEFEGPLSSIRSQYGYVQPDASKIMRCGSSDDLAWKEADAFVIDISEKDFKVTTLNAIERSELIYSIKYALTSSKSKVSIMLGYPFWLSKD